MTSKDHFYNNMIGWILFAVTFVVYALTIEPNASYWDCGEYIAVACNLEIAHSPGAALFQIIGAALSVFSFGDQAKLPMIINLMSALSSALTILFLFWTITHLARKIVLSLSQDPITKAQSIAILGSGITGSLAYAFSDSFWFSAVEGEVYAMGSLFTALLFWLVLKWENDHSLFADRWLILISFVTGLGIGVHLLVLLVIPAIGLIYYFKRFKNSITFFRFIIANIIIAIIFGVIFKVIFPYTMKFFGMMEIFVVNTFGLPFNSGTFIAMVLLIGSVVGGLYVTYKKGKYYLNTAILSLTFMLIGFSCWLVIPIRASANPPINLNDPSDAIGMLDYFNREQYGNWPVLYGPSYAAYDYIQQGLEGQVDKGAIYEKDEKAGIYKEIGRKKEYKFKSEYNKFFPRMYAPSSKEHYEDFLGKQMPPGEMPSLLDEIAFFMNYQFGHMYLRYFLWNFAGRQNDIPSEGKISKGNWKSGIGFIDTILLGDQNKLPRDLKNNKANNQYYFLPLIFGVIGLLFHVNTDPKRFYAILTIFLLTGIGILLYTNNKVFEPRERDYALVGSFYIFAVWIGLSVLALFEFSKKKQSVSVAIGATAIIAIAPVLMGFQNWDDHDRSKRYTAFAEANNYFNACKENSILVVYGDNDTYPLWSLQEVQGYRRDLKIINHLLLASDWHAQQAKRKTLDAEAVPSILPLEDYGREMNDELIVFDDPTIKSLTAKEAIEFIRDQKTGKYDQYLKNLKESELQKMNDVVAFYNQLETGMKGAIAEGSDRAAQAMQQLGDVQSRMKYFSRIRNDFKKLDLKKIAVLPTPKIIIPVDKQKVLKNGIVSQRYADQIVDSIALSLPVSYEVSEEFIGASSLMKNDIMMLDILATNDWDRGIYFGGGGTSEAQSVFFLQDYLEYNGFVYQLVPVKTKKGSRGDYGMIDTNKLLSIYNNFKWGNLSDREAYFDNTSRTRNLITFRNTATRLADQLIKEGRSKEAIAVLDTLMKNIPYEYYESFLTSFIMEGYLDAGAYQKAFDLIALFKNDLLRNYDYYLSLNSNQLSTVSYDARRNGAETSTLLATLLMESRKLEAVKLHSDSISIKGLKEKLQLNNQEIETIQNKITSIIQDIEIKIDDYARTFLKEGFGNYLQSMDELMPAYEAFFEAQEMYENLKKQGVSDDSIPSDIMNAIKENYKGAKKFQEDSQQVIQQLSSRGKVTQFMMLAYPYEEVMEFKEHYKTEKELAKDSVYQQMRTLLLVQNAMQE
ncbi:MAG: DUF2723 domain-containing protein [Flavobacteriales bacterium]